MTSPLLRNEITDRIEVLRPSLSATQLVRLRTIRDLVDDAGRFVLRPALEQCDFGNANDFQDFLSRVNVTADGAGVDLKLEVDDDHGWFSGGDVVEQSIASFTDKASGRTDITVEPEVAEIGASRRTRVYVSFCAPNQTAARKVKELLEQLRTALALDTERHWDVHHSDSVGLGEHVEDTLDRLSAEADIRVALISPAYLNDADERRRGLSQGRVIAFAFGALPSGQHVNLHPLQRHDVRRANEPWEELAPKNRRYYVDDLESSIRRALNPPDQLSAAKPLEDWAVKVAHKRGRDESKHIVHSEATETSFQESQLNRPAAADGPPLRAVERLVDWVMDDQPGAARLCALLGDVGMGKTTTAKLFSQRLLQLRKKDAGVPLPILFDLREVRIPELRTAMTLDEILDGVLDMTRPANVSKERLNARVVREHVDRGEAVIVFDGLDEVLVHLSPHDQTLFTRQLWRALDEDGGSKMLLTCRTQYFRTIRDEVTYFTGETRAGLRADDYLALLMRPFRDDQVREYLIANLDCDQARVDGFLETIAAVHDLPDLARRPITLRLIADQLDFIEQATLEGRTIYSVDIYSEVVDRWISRDAGKHTLTPDHKRLLMEEIAAALWRSGQNAWSPAEVDEWLLEVLEHRPDLRRHYGQQMPELWKADFRTATFLKREGDEFQFAHRSLFEYFLAQYLFRALSSPSANFEALAMAVPNLETLGFLAQSVASAPDKHRAAALNSLRLIASSYEPEVSELALAYALHAERHGHPHQSLVGVQLAGADLRDWEFGAEDRDVSLLLARANFAGADLRHTSFAKTDLVHADFTGADLASAEFHSSTLTGSSWQETRAAGVILRECRVDGDVLGGASLHRTQVLNCTPSPDPRPGLLVAPHADPGQFPHPRVGHFTANASTICGTAWSPDGSHIATASSDGTASLWDATTGELVHTFIGHTDFVRAVSWSPDGTRIVTSSDDQTARVWNTVTGETTHLLTGHTDWVQSVAWAPDGAHILTGSDDGTARIWSTATGRTTRLLNPGDGIVIAVAWSPDSTRLVLAMADAEGGATDIHDATTGDRILRLVGHGDGSTRTVAWSPNGSRIVTGGGGDHTAYVWDAMSGALVHCVSDLSGAVDVVAWSPDSTHFLTGSDTDSAAVWNADSKQLVMRLDEDRRSQAIAWSPDGSRVVVCSGSHAQIWHPSGDADQALAPEFNYLARQAVAWSPDGTHLLMSSEGNTARMWNTTSRESAVRLAGHLRPVRSVAWSPDAAKVITGGYDDTARIWDVATAETVLHLTGHEGAVNDVAWSPDGSMVITGSQDGTACIWNTNTGEPVLQLSCDAQPVKAVAWVPDGTRVLTVTERNSIRLWTISTGEFVDRPFGSYFLPVLSPDNSRVITGASDGHATICDAATGEPIHKLTGHVGSVSAAAWSPDGTRVITGSDDQTARIWNATTGEMIHNLVGHTDWVLNVSWSPDGTRVLTTGDDNTIRIWDAATGAPGGPTFLAPNRNEIAVYDPSTNEILGATKDAWRWLGWTVVEDGRMTRLPAETFGPIPLIEF